MMLRLKMLVPGFVLLTAPGYALAAAPAVDTAAPVNAASLYSLDATWRDQAGRSVKLSSLSGHPLILTMAFTHCEASCPLTVSDMQAIARRLTPAAREKLRMVLVSFDPARDTPERLKQWADARKLASPPWVLLTGVADDVRDLAAALGVRYKPTSKGDFTHSAVLFVVAPDGTVKHQQVGLRSDPAESAAILETLASQ